MDRLFLFAKPPSTESREEAREIEPGPYVGFDGVGQAFLPVPNMKGLIGQTGKSVPTLLQICAVVQ